MAVCPLFLGPSWGYDPYWIAAVNRMLIDDLNHLARETNSEISMHCALLKEENQITAEERQAAKKCNVSSLFGAKLPLGRCGSIDVDSMNIHPSSYYGHIREQCKNVTHIISHVPEYLYAAFNMKQSLLERKLEDLEPKIVLVVHDLPKNSEGKVQEEEFAKLLSATALVLSLGKEVYHAIESILATCDRRPSHVCYIPNPPIDLFQIERPPPKNNNVQGLQNILLFATNLENMDFKIAVSAVTTASDVLIQNATEKDHVKVVFYAMHGNAAKNEDYKSTFEEHKKSTNARHKKLQLFQETSPSKEKVTKLLKKSKLCIYPASTESTVLGMEVLMAAYSGLPVLVSEDTGAAGMFDCLHLKDSIVKCTGDFDADVEIWSSEIVKKLKDPQAAFEEAKRVREVLLLDSAIPTSHLEFIAELCSTYIHNIHLLIN